MGTSEVVLSAQLSAGELITEPCCKSVCVCVLMCALGAPIWWSSFSGESIRNRKSILNMKINVFWVQPSGFNALVFLSIRVSAHHILFSFPVFTSVSDSRPFWSVKTQFSYLVSTKQNDIKALPYLTMYETLASCHKKIQTPPGHL